MSVAAYKDLADVQAHIARLTTAARAICRDAGKGEVSTCLSDYMQHCS